MANRSGGSGSGTADSGGREPGGQEEERHFQLGMEMLTDRTRPIATKGCQLPGLDQFFAAEPWELPELASSRGRVNDAKSRLDGWDNKWVERSG